jgi:MoaA/NifB/PqqE/SkfB family radical SAM enzyme
MTFCYSPWTNLDISPQGTISPCCKFQLKHYDQQFNVQTNSLLEYVESDFLKSVRQQFMQNEWPAGCERCKIEEQNGIDSKRNLDFQRWQEHYNRTTLENNKFITASVAFGNTCNLKCITCSSFSSSKWQQEYSDVYKQTFQPVHFYQADFVNTLISQMPNLVHLDIPGGEPLLSGVREQKQLLTHYVETGQAQSITLHYTTNASLFPNDSWLELWKNFREIDIQLSVDGIGSRYEYIRYPASWNTLQDMVARYIELEREQDNIRLSVSHTVSAYNILYVPEFLKWCSDTGLPEPWLGRVHHPLHMRPEVWPAAVRKIIQARLLEDSNSISRTWASMLNQDSSEFFADFVKYTTMHDKHRSLDFRTTFPELANFYEI